jgi:hypothetical protein
MKKIQNEELIYRQDAQWVPGDLAFVETLSLEYIKERFPLLDVRIDFLNQRRDQGGWPDTAKPFSKIVLLFKNVSAINLKFGRGYFQQIAGFQIKEVSERGLENISFEVSDYENEVIEFTCSDIEVVSVEEPRQYFV